MEILHISLSLQFAGNPYFIDLDTLVEEGVLDKKDCEKVNWGKKPDEVDYAKNLQRPLSSSEKSIREQ